MKRHLTASAVNLGTSNEHSTVGRVATRTHTDFDSQNTHTQPDASEPSFVLQKPGARTHTLVLTGALDGRSAHALEAAIEHLCEEGVVGVTLDLRELIHIDSIGVAVIMFRCGLCKRRGYDFALIPGSGQIQSAFEQAGVADLLPFCEEQVAASRLPAMALAHRSRDSCE
jgi:anti-anti-sigma factor